MNVIHKCLLLLLLIGGLAGLYLLFPNVGYVNVIFLQYKLYINFYILVGGLIVLFFVRSIIKSLVLTIKKFFKKLEEKRNIKSVQNLARSIISGNVSDIDLDPIYEVCKTAVLVKNGVSVNQSTEIAEIDMSNIKLKLQHLIQVSNFDTAVNLITTAINNFPYYLSIIQDEILQVAINATLNGKSFTFNPSCSKYKLQQSFIDEYNIKICLAEADRISDIGVKLKILEKLYKKYENNVEVAKKLLSLLISDPLKYKTQIRGLIKNLFKIKPDRNLAFIFLKTSDNTLKSAEEILKDVCNGVEKFWFLLIVAVQSKLYPKIIEFIELLIANNANYDELCVFFVKNYAILSSDNTVVKMLCK